MDIKCVVCGEPWDSYGVTHGDMLPWEAKLFRAGAGCPSCEGKPNGWMPTTISDVENGDLDPMLRIVARERFEAGEAPRWERPCDAELWVCDGCGVRVVRNADTNELEYDVRWGAKCRQWYHSHDFDRGTPEESPAHVFKHGAKVCEFCLTHCSECGTELCSHLEYSDVYDEGNPIPDPRDEYHASVCIDCLDVAETEAAQEVWRTCYSDAERIDYIREHRSQFEFRSFADMLGCVRGRYFAGYASELLS